MRVDVDGAHDDSLVLGDDVRDVGHDADVVVADDAQCDGVLRLSLSVRCILMPPPAVTKPKMGSP